LESKIKLKDKPLVRKDGAMSILNHYLIMALLKNTLFLSLYVLEAKPLESWTSYFWGKHFFGFFSGPPESGSG
jgi:hypothetical protein